MGQLANDFKGLDFRFLGIHTDRLQAAGGDPAGGGRNASGGDSAGGGRNASGLEDRVAIRRGDLMEIAGQVDLIADAVAELNLLRSEVVGVVAEPDVAQYGIDIVDLTLEANVLRLRECLKTLGEVLPGYTDKPLHLGVNSLLRRDRPQKL